ncbi:XrtB/PEP-CTERM-associated polysaccharide biosynthesis outer membrane protein EpsL [Rhodoferax sp.]|uniref:XrtB/PEP-CTERM-associated polysaccharide biosynthesis outer membrane protein EpsL n=1 Tax=Rhodoferax sp. TaxID=50421 RepID=UPI00271858B2|nr:XrtB/PEP-CTERM-associated polysaccharide biosynthesis outer membrane protein EpsL [Rhodoferax sp.]MDO9197557.1 putative exosortase B-associated extracellular polysaccharide biosynthesis transporter EpsL [Rhodoferax sp.]
MQQPLRSWLTPALLVVFSSAPALAQVEDTFKLSAAYSQQTDSNLFRLPAGANVTALIGKPSAAEQIGITSLGLNVNKAYSLQRFELSLSLIDYQYQNFSYLSFAAHNYNAAWRWALTPRLHGNFTSERNETLNSFADYQGFSVRNQRTNTNTRFDAEYEIDGPWRLLGGLSESAQTNQQVLLAEGDSSATSADIGLRYAFASGSSISYSFKNANGTYLNRTPSATGLYDDGFNQTDNALRLHWVISGNTTADISAAHIQRTHPHYAQRDYSGNNAAASLKWNITGKSTLAAGWVREISSYQTASSNYSQTDRFSLGPIWQVSPKAVVRLRHEVAQRDYLAPPTGQAATRRSDTTRDTSLSFDWQPYQSLILSASLQNASRVSNLAGLDYDSNMATLSAQFTF